MNSPTSYGRALMKQESWELVPTFKLRLVQADLFGMVEAANQDTWFAAFRARSSTVRVSLDETALNMIADELEIDADGLVTSAERYIQGRFREKAQGLGGPQLGESGEVFTFLVNRAVRGREIIPTNLSQRVAHTGLLVVCRP